jgi:hypothetical protein
VQALAHRAVAAAVIVAIVVAALAAADIAGTASAAAVRNVASGRWSDPAIWEHGRVPGGGDRVEIARGTEVTYDLASKAELGDMVISGALRFSRERSTSLDVGGVTVNQGGLLEIGTPDNPIPRDIKAMLRIVSEEDGENGIEILGEAQLHGHPLRRVYTRLVADAHAGAREIQVTDAVDWKAGDHIVITSTTRRPEDTEESYVQAINGRTIVLSHPLLNWHGGVAPAQAEVANLTRNVVITSKDPARRGHTRFMHGAKGSISYAEFARLGARNQLGKYPIHFHMAGDSMKGSYVKGVAVWDSGNRFITVHSTQSITLSDNVGYNAIGHGFFMEMGDEVYVTWERNLGILVKPGELLKTDANPSVFWIQNPVNTYVDNIAVSSTQGHGFEFRLPGKPMDIAPLRQAPSTSSGQSQDRLLGGKHSPADLTVLRFEGNEAHSNAEAGLRTYPALNRANSEDVSRFVGLKLWRNRTAGATLRANRASLEDSLVFGNGDVNVAIRGDDNVIRGTRLLGALGDVPLKNRGRGVQQYAPTSATLKGATFLGEGNAIKDSILEGHGGSGDATGSDVSLVQDEKGKSSLIVSSTLLKSERTIIFGYPMSDKSIIVVESYQQQPGEDFALFRLDAEPTTPCVRSTSTYFIALVCK